MAVHGGGADQQHLRVPHPAVPVVPESTATYAAGDANLAGQVYPDQSLYPANSVPSVVRRINNALLRADEIAKVEGTTLVPLSQIEQRFTELDANQTIYLHCKAGVRSLKALGFLREQGFKYLKSVKGGITAWSEEIDPNVPTY